jgi:hypothetical protein
VVLNFAAAICAINFQKNSILPDIIILMKKHANGHRKNNHGIITGILFLPWDNKNYMQCKERFDLPHFTKNIVVALPKFSYTFPR